MAIGMPDANPGPLGVVPMEDPAGARLGLAKVGPAGLVPDRGVLMSPSPCHVRGLCGYGPGHAIHWIQAGLAGRSPWGWRDGVVKAWDGELLRIRYVVEDHAITVWHHVKLSGELPIGTPVRVHEAFHVLATASGWYCVEITGGLGPVPEPEQPELWAHEAVPGIVDLATGVGLAVDAPPEDK